ncbi:MAG TPA: hypothetical protein VJ183_12145 [Chloroflexia bacterium]|nr:hypothetical protein [Chloroflexia bacterium]
MGSVPYGWAIGEALLFDKSKRGIGASLLAVAAVLAIVAWSGVRANILLTPPADTVRQEADQRKELIRRRRGLALWLVSVSRRLDPFVGVRLMQPSVTVYQVGDLSPNQVLELFRPLPMSTLLDRDVLVRWSGKLYASGGPYRMELVTESDNRAQLKIDGSLMVSDKQAKAANGIYRS